MPHTLTRRRVRPLWLALSIAAALAACAPGPDSIAPVAMPGGMYDHLSCQAARAERATLAQEVAALESRQRSAQAGDAFGVLLLGVPTASLFGGNVAGDLGAAKGKLLALDARLGRC